MYITLYYPLILLANLYSELTSLPTKLTQSKENIFIIPAVFLNRNLILRSCKSLMSCLIESFRYIPSTKQELYTCYLNDTCFIQKGQGANRNHVLCSLLIFILIDVFIKRMDSKRETNC